MFQEIDLPTISSKQAEREKLNKDIEEYLIRGGKITILPPFESKEEVKLSKSIRAKLNGK